MLDNQNMEEFEDDAQPSSTLPKSLEGRISSRSMLMNSLRAILTSMNTDDDGRERAHPARVVFFTPAGQIYCDFVTGAPEEPLDHAFDAIYQTNLDMIRSMEEEQELNIIGSASYILVKNATLQPWNAPRQKYRYDRMCLFVDDIIGYTFML